MNVNFFGSSPAAVEKITGVQAEEANDDSAPKATHRVDEILDQDVVKKKARVTYEKENPEAQIVTQNAGNDCSTKPSSKKEVAASTTVVAEEDLAKSSVAVEEGSNSTNPAAAMTCQTQTNGHNNPNAGSSGSSDVPVGAQRCF